MHKKENRKFADDSWDIAVGRVVFIKWMKSRGLWSGYLVHLGDHPKFFKNAWKYPLEIGDFLGECSYEYDVFINWDNYCNHTLKPLIKSEKYGYIKSHQGD